MIASRRMRWGRHVSHMRETRWLYKIVVVKSEEKGHPLRRLSIEGNIL
jgi:hypothetical protein